MIFIASFSFRNINHVFFNETQSTNKPCLFLFYPTESSPSLLQLLVSVCSFLALCIDKWGISKGGLQLRTCPNLHELMEREGATERAASGRWERGGIIFRNIEILEISISWGPKNRSSGSDPEAWRFRAFSSRIWDFFGGLFYIKLYIGRDLYTDPRWIVLEVAAQKCETFDDQWKTGCNLRESIAAPPSLFGFFG